MSSRKDDRSGIGERNRVSVLRGGKRFSQGQNAVGFVDGVVEGRNDQRGTFAKSVGKIQRGKSRFGIGNFSGGRGLPGKRIGKWRNDAQQLALFEILQPRGKGLRGRPFLSSRFARASLARLGAVPLKTAAKIIEAAEQIPLD